MGECVEIMQYKKKYERDNELLPVGWEHEKSLRDYNSDVLGYQ